MNETRPEMHPTISTFARHDGCLHVGGVPLTRLADRVGQTPFFVYDRSLLNRRIQALRTHLPDEVALHYAIKANPMPAVVQHLAGLVDGFDVASGLELKTALDTPMPAEHIGFAGPGKSVEELAQAVAADVVIEVESLGEIGRIAELARRQRLRPRIAIRVNPDFELKGAGMRMGGGPRQFGIDAEQVPQAMIVVAHSDLEFIGFHIFAGSQNLRSDILQQVQEQTIDLAIALSQHASAPVRYLNIGGGFGIPYFTSDTPLDVHSVGKNLGRLIRERLRPALPEARVIMELGRYVVGEAGLYVTRIIDRKVSRGQIFLVTDGGLHHQLAASGNFGQLIRRNYPVAIGNRMDQPEKEKVSIVGCLCTPLDLLADREYLPTAEVGDLIVVFQSGAYGLTASPVNFLSHPLPPEILV
ncbi:pyridoxal-dependent decarboxylase, exosortase A system-associated [Mesorhizobium sp. KR2-14]|uniref:pyridoxal-dependent decarboxylase, exosortase A system-associated n=1 Tax=Mesorhizobium sp. KR2-14 TaxID=3156610 RepID=UPI0032B36AB8